MNFIKIVFEKYIAGKFPLGKFLVVRWGIKLFRFSSLRSHHGPILNCNGGDFTNIAAIAGNYGYVISDHIKSLPPKSVFIDIGSSYGLYTFLFANKFVEGLVFSFEPNPKIFYWLKSAIELNNVNNVIPFNCALGKDDCDMEMNYKERHSGGSKLKIESSKNTLELESFTVPVKNIAKIDLIENSLEGRHIHVKIDVEGYETEIINSIRQSGWYKEVNSIIAEIDNRNLIFYQSSASELYEILINDGFEARFGIIPNRHYDEIFTRKNL